MQKIASLIDRIRTKREEYETKDGRVKDGCNYRWNELFRHECALKDAIEVMDLYKCE